MLVIFLKKGQIMYHPYLRGKQYELILLKENAKLISKSSIIPIIEPVKKNTAPLNKAIESLMEENIEFIVTINPKHGDYKSNPLPLIDMQLILSVIIKNSQWLILLMLKVAY